MGIIKKFNSLFDLVDRIKKERLFKLIFVFIFVSFIWQNYLGYRQYRVQVDTKEIPKGLARLEENFEKSRAYAIDRSLFKFAKSTFNLLNKCAFLYFGGYLFIWKISASQLNRLGVKWMNSEIPTSLLSFIYYLIYEVISKVPLEIYDTFVIEKRHGFNDQTFRYYVISTLSDFMFKLLISLPFIAIYIFILKNSGDYGFIYSWILTFLIAMIFIPIYGEYLVFDTMKLASFLPNNKLVTDIKYLAGNVSFPIDKIYVTSGSNYSNAFAHGIFNSKRIILYDTLFSNLTRAVNNVSKSDETLAIVAHELGHLKLDHILKIFIINMAISFFYYLVLSVLVNRNVIYTVFGFENEKPIIVAFVVISYMFIPLQDLLTFFSATISKRFEFEADAFSKTFVNGEFLKSALITLKIDNLSFPFADWLYTAWYSSHPSLIERLKALD